MPVTGLETALLLKGVKYIGICLFVWFIEPIIGFVVIQVDTVAFLSPYMKSFLNDIKIILGVLVTLLLAIKYFYAILKSKKK